MGRVRFAGLGLTAVMCVTTLVGCHKPGARRVYYPHARSETLVETGEEHQHRVMQSAERDRLLLQEDLDLLFQTERPTRLTRWQSK